MRFKIKDKRLVLMQSSIDVALWVLVENNSEQFDHTRNPYAYMLTYVDDFLIMGPRDVRNTIEEEISRTWKSKLLERLISLISRTPMRR